jgi:mycofactocin radical SAM maturase
MTTTVGSLLEQAWRLSPSVALRPEPFGALAYHFGNRKLTFLKRPELVSVVRGLEGHDDVRSALVEAGVPEGQWPAYESALRSLAATDMIHPRAGKGGSPVISPAGRPVGGSLVERFEYGLDAPICLTWELTYACNLACVHCLSSSGRRDPRELTTAQSEAVIDELQRMQVFYVNIGGGEPTIRADFWHLLEYAVDHRVGVKFSTNGVRITRERARFLASTDYIDVQVSLDGATAEVNDHVRGAGSYQMAVRALGNLAEAGFRDAKLSVVVTRHNIGQLDWFKALADRFGAVLRLTRLRPSGRGADVWDELHPLPEQQRGLYDWLRAHGERVLTGDSFFHLAAFGEKLPGLNLCGAGRVVCLIDPVGDVYACPFAIHDRFLAGNVLAAGGFQRVWQSSALFQELRSPQTSGACTSCRFFDSCRGGCMAAKFFTGLPTNGPDPECVRGHGEAALIGERRVPAPTQDHSRRTPTRTQPVLLRLGRREDLAAPPVSACAEHPLAGYRP